MTCREASVASAHSGVGSQTITDPDNGFNERWMTKLAAQPTDGDSDSVAERIGVRIPNVLEKLFSTHRRAIRNEESLQHAEIGRASCRERGWMWVAAVLVKRTRTRT